MRAKFTSLFLVLFLGYSSCLLGQSYGWTKTLSGTPVSNSRAMTMDTDNNEDIVIGGRFYGEVDFDPGPLSTTYSAPNFYNPFIAKYDPQGNLIWASRFTGTSRGEVNDLVCDSIGNIYAIGQFSGTYEFSGGVVEVSFSSSSPNFHDIFILKLDPNGQVVWVFPIHTPIFDHTPHISLDAQGNVYVAGAYYLPTDFDPGPGQYIQSSIGSRDVFVAKYTPNGDFVWAETGGGNLHSWVNDLAVTKDGTVYAAVYNMQGATYGPYSLSWNGMIKLDSSGQYLWVKPFGGLADNESKIVLNDQEDIFIGGLFYSSGDFDPGPNSHILLPYDSNPDGYICKWDSSANLDWVKQFTGPGKFRCTGIDLDLGGRIVLAGDFTDVIDFNPDSAASFSLLAQFRDAFHMRLTSSGDFDWANQITGIGEQKVWGMQVTPTNHLLSAGFFNDSTDFDPSVGHDWGQNRWNH